MKKAVKTEKRFEGKKAVKTHEAGGKTTEAQDGARAVESIAKLVRGEAHGQEWLTAQFELALHPITWVEIASLAQRQGGTVGGVLSSVIERHIERHILEENKTLGAR